MSDYEKSPERLKFLYWVEFLLKVGRDCPSMRRALAYLEAQVVNSRELSKEFASAVDLDAVVSARTVRGLLTLF